MCPEKVRLFNVNTQVNYNFINSFLYTFIFNILEVLKNKRGGGFPFQNSKKYTHLEGFCF